MPKVAVSIDNRRAAAGELNIHYRKDFNMKKKHPGPSWKNVEKRIGQFDNKQLIQLVRDMYHLSLDNKDFFSARFSIGEDPLARYKKIIQNSIHPCLEDNETLDVGQAIDAVNRYVKAVDNPAGEAELRLHYVECGNNFTLSYGDIDEDFYDEMLTMYEYAIETVLELPQKEQAAFQVRLQNVMNSASGIGWGYHDGLCDLYYEVFADG